MKSINLTIVIILLLAPAAFARDDSLLARVTVYWASGGSGSDRDTRHHRCATGARLRDGHCAVDPRHIPYGSRVLLPNGESLAAVDTGSAVKNRKAARQSGHTAFERGALVVDRFFETKHKALAWANSHPAFMPIKIVRPNFRALAVTSAKLQRPGQTSSQTVMNTGPAQAIKSPTAAQFAASKGSPSRAPLNRMGR